MKEKIIVGVDARPLQHATQYRGIGKVLYSLIFEFIRNNDIDFSYYVDSSLPIPKIIIDNNLPITETRSSPLRRKKIIRAFLNPFHMIRPNNKDVDIFLQIDANLGIPKKVKSIVVFHDLIPLLFRDEEYKEIPITGVRSLKKRVMAELFWWRYIRTLQSYKRASHIIAISEASKKDLIKYDQKIIENNVSVVYLGGDTSKKIRVILDEKYKRIEFEKYILYVGGIDYRKNILMLLDTYLEARRTIPELKLYLVGKEFGLTDTLEDIGWFEKIKKSNIKKNDIYYAGYVDDSSLQLFYKHAIAFIFPSRYEGFGLPPLEAMANSCPVITLSNSSIPEVVGDAGLYCDNHIDMANALIRTYKDPELRKVLIKKGYRQNSLFTWSESAEKYYKIFNKIYKNNDEQ